MPNKNLKSASVPLFYADISSVRNLGRELLSTGYKTTSGQTLPRQNLRLSEDTAVCFWTKQPSEFGSVFAGLLEGNPEEVGELYRSVWRGKLANIDDPSAFYALTLSGAQGRAIVRDWLESTVQVMAHNLNQHFADLDIVRNTKPAKGQKPPPCFALGPFSNRWRLTANALTFHHRMWRR